jgi:3-oxoacyl-[acyl-carrier-protein] synthase II
MSRVVITGLGAISPIGNNVDTFWENLTAGVSGAGQIESFDVSNFDIKIACEVKDFNPTDYMDRKLARRIARSIQFSVATSRQALKDANFEVTPDNAERVGVIYNSGGGGLSGMEEATHKLDADGPRSVSPFLITNIMMNAVSSMVSIELGTMGPLNTSSLACASGLQCFVEGYHTLQRNEADVLIIGGSEAAISPVIFASFNRMGALSTRNGDPTRASRPFDKDRDGFVFGEGGAAFIIEREEHALARGARIYAEVLGGRLTSDGYHVTAPRPDAKGTTNAIKGALATSGLSADAVDTVFAHATSTPLGDTAEVLSLKNAFGERAYQIPVSGTKSMVGHMLGAAGSIAALAAVKSIETGIIPPTINYETPDPNCDLDFVPNVARKHNTNVALINAFGFGGHNVAILIGKYSSNGA